MSNGNGTEEIAQLEVLANEVVELRQGVQRLESVLFAPTAAAGVVYRPPLWSQNSAYSSADDRRLIASTLVENGVIDRDDLRVHPRLEGANLSVDVEPGTVAVKGTEQLDQGTYLCPLSQRVNITLTAGPSGGNSRYDLIVARVYEAPGPAPGGGTLGPEDEGQWRCEVLQGEAAASPQWPAPPHNSTVLAVIGPIGQNTTQITEALILDCRAQARPSPIGANVVQNVQLPYQWPWDSNNWPGRWWGPAIQILAPPWPVDIAIDLSGAFESSELWQYSELGAEIYLSTDSRAGWNHWDQSVFAVSPGSRIPAYFSATLDVVNQSCYQWIQARVYTYIRPPFQGAYPYRTGITTRGNLRVRLSPSPISYDFHQYPIPPQNRPGGA